MLPVLNQEKLKKITGKYNISLVIAFGSRVKGTSTNCSDFDLGVWLGDLGDRGLLPVEPGGYRAIFSDLVELFSIGCLHVVILNTASPLLIHEVALNGKPLYQRQPGMYTSFCARAVQLHQDAYPFYMAERRYLEKYLEARKDG